MKLLFDQNLSFKLCELLSDLFPGSEQVGRIGLGQADDLTIWRYAASNEYALVSKDGDFAELALFAPEGAKVIWLRCGNQGTAYIARLLRDHSATLLSFGRDEAAVCLEVY